MRIPKLCRDKRHNVAFVCANGGKSKIYLGKWGAPETEAAYRRYVAVLAEPSRPKLEATRAVVTLADLAAAFLAARANYYVKLGKQTRRLARFKTALEYPLRYFPTTPVDEFGPSKLLFCRDEMEKSGRFARSYVNTLVNCFRAVVKWGVGRELVAPQVLIALQAVEGLKPTKSAARETTPVLPVPAAVVDATLPFLPPAVAAMVRIQRLTGMRPGEVCAMRFGDVDRSGDVWIYTPRHHKTEARRAPGDRKKIPLGRRAQAILTPYLAEKADDPDAFLFSPRDDARDRFRKARARFRKHSTKNAEPLDKFGRIGESYAADAYGKIVRRAATKAGVESWSPNRLRHLYATEIRANFGLEAAQIMLGHARTDVTQIYAERDFQKAVQIAAEIG